MSREINRRCLDAMALIESGHLDQADRAYDGILRDAELEEGNDLPEVCGQIAVLKYRLGRIDDALLFHARALREALAREDPAALRVSVYRYFIAEFLIDHGRANEALAHVEAGLGHSEDSDRLMRVTQARCLWALERRDDAKTAALLAMRLAKTDEQRDANLAILADILAY